MSDHTTTHVVTCFLRNRGEVLLLRRSEDVGSYSGRWGAVAGHAEGDPDGAAREEIREESGLRDAVSFVRADEPFAVEDADLETQWVVHPYLFDCESRNVEVNYETTEFEWVSPTAIRRRETVPDLWRSYERIAPTVETIEADGDHGSAWLSVRALEILRDRAGVLATNGEDEPDGWDELAALAGDLRAARPSMTVLENRVNRALADATDETPEALERAAIAGIERAFVVDAAAAGETASLLDGPVMTLSRSGTVLDALRQVDKPVVVAESRPACEGVGVAETLVAVDRPVTLITDAAVAHVLSTRSIACVLVGADTILPDGRVLNKVGTRGMAIAAANEDVPVYAVAASDKISVDNEPDFEEGSSEAVYDGSEGIDVANPTFDLTPAELVTVVTEDGPLDGESIPDRAEEFAALAARTQEPSPDPE